MNREIEKILILSIPGIGNTIMITPMIKLIYERIPNAKIVVLVTLTGSKEILEICPFVDEVISVDGRMFHKVIDKLKVILNLRSRKFDVCITAFPANDIRYNILTWLIGAKCKIGHSYPTKRLRTLPNLLDIRIPMSKSRHDIMQNLDLLKPLGISVDNNDIEMKIWVDSDDIDKAKQFFYEHKIVSDDIVIGMHPGSSEKRKMIYKRWPKEKFAALGENILKEYPKVKILLFGGPEEEMLKREIAIMMKEKPIIVSDMSMREVTVIIERCNLFISNDSGLMHVACAMKAPTVAIFGPTDPVATAPLGDGHIVVKNDLPCQPCWPIELYGNRPECKRNPPYSCLTNLPVEKVFEAARTLLQSNVKRTSADKSFSHSFVENVACT